MDKELLTIDDLCKILDIGRTTAYRLIKTKKIKSGKLGNKIRITRKALVEYISNTLEES